MRLEKTKLGTVLVVKQVEPLRNTAGQVRLQIEGALLAGIPVTVDRTPFDPKKYTTNIRPGLVTQDE